MRLAQLARKISVKQAEIAEFLETHNIQIDNSSNAKVNDEHVELVLEHFAPEMISKAETDAEEPSSQVEADQADVEDIYHKVEDAETINEVEAPDEIAEVPEVIKPIKVELPGLKVMGKIDLPEPKMKEGKSAEDNDAEKTGGVEDTENEQSDARKSYPERRKVVRPKREHDRRPRKNPVALQREREERDALNKKLEKDEKEKELRTQRYLKKVSAKATAPKPARKRKEEDYEIYTAEVKRPKTFIGKILSWFVSE